ncbi:MAG TPA: ISKra4 family transposase, partial [Pseudonocardiaceae bacterium]|nr:ISKra4 family transposase [Pseudonocardiaceae bacterium]
MKVTVQVVVQAGDDTDAPSVVREVLSLDREALAPDTLGLQRGEAMDLLSAVQGALVDEQAKAALATRVACPECGRPRRHKDSRA